MTVEIGDCVRTTKPIEHTAKSFTVDGQVRWSFAFSARVGEIFAVATVYATAHGSWVAVVIDAQAGWGEGVDLYGTVWLDPGDYEVLDE